MPFDAAEACAHAARCGAAALATRGLTLPPAPKLPPSLLPVSAGSSPALCVHVMLLHVKVLWQTWDAHASEGPRQPVHVQEPINVTITMQYQMCIACELASHLVHEAGQDDHTHPRIRTRTVQTYSPCIAQSIYGAACLSLCDTQGAVCPCPRTAAQDRGLLTLNL